MNTEHPHHREDYDVINIVLEYIRGGWFSSDPVLISLFAVLPEAFW